MKDSRPDYSKQVFSLVFVILAGWLFWVSKTVVDLQTQVAVLKYGVFKTVQKPQSRPEAYEANPDYSKFFESLKKEIK
jgi:hypothetical protein